MAATGAWVAVSDDKTELALFSSEITAWRFGGPRKMSVVPWGFGQTLDEALKGAGDAAPVSK